LPKTRVGLKYEDEEEGSPFKRLDIFWEGVLATTIRIITKASRRTRPRKAAAPTTIAGN